LQGFAFAIFFAVMGVPLGRLADVWVRKRLIVIGIVLWCLMTVACGLARDFSSLFIARMGVGVGEAALAPAAYSLISDIFPRHKRSKPISLFAMGPYVGGGLSFLAGALVISTIVSDLQVPVYGVLHPWQLTFIAIGAPGLLVALIIAMTVREPARKERITQENEAPPAFSNTLKFVWQHRLVFSLLTLGYSGMAMCGYAVQAWLPSYFIRIFGWTASEIGLYSGSIILVAGGTGTFAGGVWADYLLQRNYTDAYPRVSVYCSFAPFLIVLSCLMPTATGALIVLAPAYFFMGTHIGVGIAAFTQVSPNEYRGQVLSMYIFVLIVLGAGVGPFAVAVFTEHLFQDPLAVGKSIALLAGMIGVAVVTVFYSSLRPYRKMMDKIKPST
jgi:MFS family permease